MPQTKKNNTAQAQEAQSQNQTSDAVSTEQVNPSSIGTEDTSSSKKKNTSHDFNSFLERFRNLINDKETEIENSKNELKTLKLLKKDIEKEMKKKGKKHSDHSKTPKDASGFVKKSPAPPQIRHLLSLNDDDMHTRPEITGLLYKYFKQNDLQNGKEISVNKDLRHALGIPHDVTTLTFSSLQRYLGEVYRSFKSTMQNDSSAPASDADASHTSSNTTVNETKKPKTNKSKNK